MKPYVNLTSDNYEIQSTINWNIEEKISINKVQVFFTTNNSSYELYYTQSYLDYDGNITKDPLIVNLTECYQTCFNKTLCIAISWYSNNNSCILRDRVSNNRCPNSTICVPMFGIVFLVILIF